MIESAEEFKKLRESENSEEYTRASTEQADTEVWKQVLKKYDYLSVWVAQNKTVPLEILEILSCHSDSRVRSMVARKRKLTEQLMLTLAKDKDASVRNAVANNAKATTTVLGILQKDSEEFVRNSANREKSSLTKLS